MKIPQIWNRFGDDFAVHPEHNAQHAVSGRMLRAQIQQHFIVAHLFNLRFKNRALGETRNGRSSRAGRHEAAPLTGSPFSSSPGVPISKPESYRSVTWT